jgi:activator of HSP90 ATPase
LFSRRQWICQSAVAGGLALAWPAAFAESGDGITRTAEAIHQEILFHAPPKRVYDALTDAEQFQKVVLLSAAMSSVDARAHPAVIDRQPGGAFSLFGGYVSGRQIELVPNQRVVQAWRSASWGSGLFSIAHFEFSTQGASTKLVFDHLGFPAGTAEHLAAGWHANYWEPLQKFLAE